MKKLIWKLVIPITLIIFSLITMWRYVLIMDGPDEMLYGFPLAYICRGWGSSLTNQIFIAELVLDFLVYFTVVYFIVYLIKKSIQKIRLGKIVVIILYLIPVLINIDITFFYGLVFREHTFMLYREFETKTLDSGPKFRFNDVEMPDLRKYALEQQEYIENFDVSWNILRYSENFRVSFIRETDDRFLRGSMANEIQRISFIDSIITLDSINSNRLFQFFKDSTNFAINGCGDNSFYVSSGFVITINDTLRGAVHLPYDLDCIKFSPDLHSSEFWTMSGKGKVALKGFIDSLQLNKTGVYTSWN